MYARRLIAPDVDVDASSIPRAGQTVGEPEAPHPASDPMKSRRPGPSGGIATRLAASGAEAPPPDPSAEDANTRARDAAVGAPPPARVRRHSRAAALKRCDITLPRPGAYHKWRGGQREEEDEVREFSFLQDRGSIFPTDSGSSEGHWLVAFGSQHPGDQETPHHLERNHLGIEWVAIVKTTYSK